MHTQLGVMLTKSDRKFLRMVLLKQHLQCMKIFRLINLVSVYVIMYFFTIYENFVHFKQFQSVIF